MCSDGQDKKNSGGASLSMANGWNLKNHCGFTVARHMRERTKPRLPVVTLREGEERGVPLQRREIGDIIEDQVQKQGVLFLVRTKKPQFGKTRVYKRIDFKELTVSRTTKCVAEHHRDVLCKN